MTSAQIRQSFLDFFREKKHTIVPSSSLLPDSPNLLFTNAGMNQFVPIFLGQQKPQWNPPRVADTQKCIRAGGKHNDLEDVGLDTYHHTFFEMLGNWSFGDYFKKEAIEWAWELVVERWKFPAQRLYATVYKPGRGEPSEFDQEAHDHWARLFQEADLDPKIHIAGFGKADNFWMMGDTGPCGPCSELHVDLTPDGDTRGALVNKNDPRCIEIWNLVFIQFNADADGNFTPLPQRHVDTGMGFERSTAIIQGTKNLTDFSKTVSNYETDVFRPIFDEIEKLSGKKYGSTLPIVGRLYETPTAADTAALQQKSEQEKIDIAFRVIADHIRTLTFAIADGIIPSNEGRGYVLRRILRRAVRYGRSLGFHEPFFFKLVDVVAKTMGDVFPEVRKNQSRVQETIKREEESFNRTLDKGIELFNKAIADRSLLKKIVDKDNEARGGSAEVIFPSRIAFELYDTYGFPLDLTELMAREQGFTVIASDFEKRMEEQRARARAAQRKSIIEIEDFRDALTRPTDFVGYKKLEAECQVLNFGPGYVQVNPSPLYAEMGGQIGDTGKLVLDEPIEHAIEKFSEFKIINTTQRRRVFLLHLEPNAPQDLFVNIPQMGRLYVDAPRRHAIERHHTVTHILHWALHQIVSKDATQKGSYVGPDKLTFDFSSAALTPHQKRDVEKLVNEKIAENAPVYYVPDVPYVEAKKRSDIQQFFGDKYDEKVRVVQIGGDPDALNGYSMELCGGTHVGSTSEIGPFRIVKEEAIAAGIRRIEAVTGEAARDWAKVEAAKQQEKFESLARKKPDLASLPTFDENAETSAMLDKIDMRAAHLDKLDAEVRDWEKKHAKSAEADLKKRAGEIASELASSKIGQKICVASVPDGSAKLLQAVIDVLRQKFAGPIVLAGVSDGKVALAAAVPKDMTSKFQANKIIQEIAPIVGGKGGGRPENAQGAGSDAAKLDEALAKARDLLA